MLFTLCLGLPRAHAETIELGLKDALGQALTANPEIKKATKERSVSALQLDSTRSSYLPKLALEISGGTARDKDLFTDETVRPKVNRDHNFYHSDLVASYNLFRGFADRNANLAKESALRQSSVAEMDAKARIIRDVIATYFRVQLIQRKIKAEEEARVLRSKQLTEVRNRQRAGSATKLDVLQAEYALKSTEPQIHEFKNDLNLELIKLQYLLQVEPEKKVKLKDTLEKAFASTSTLKTPPLTKLYELALQNNFALKNIQAEQDKLQAELHSGQGTYWPSVDLRFIAASRAFMKDEVFDDEVRTYRGELAITLPLFDGLSSFADRAAIHEKLASQGLELQIEKEKLLTELTDHYQKRELSYQLYESEQANLALAEESIKQARDLYEAGAAKLTDVLDAYTQKFDAIKNAGEAMLNHIVATAWLQYLTDSLPALTNLEEKS